MNDSASTSAIAQLLAERARIDAQIAAAQLPALQAIQAVMNRPSTSKIADDLEKLRADLPEGQMAHEQVGNVITVIRAVKDLIDQDVARVEAQIETPEPA
ncbi:hypothetical protein [Sphingobium agri]|uniref:Uncharacterized protein n=1 Tax=Sphingobium agri TaxID=2933566 RepID=A0ABT0DXC6_9SPHN|nr:hypothetical protein [Sphingobium agri]MCK0531782.1 hypothetical protein [Sphingobium agri]